MPLKIVRNDIVNMRVDAIVNSTNAKLKSAGMGVDAYIHQSAGPELQKACDAIGGCEPGGAVITSGFNLPSKYVIHTVGPVWQGGRKGEKELLKSCYRNILGIAAAYKLSSIAVPVISAGAYGYPKREALEVASKEIRRFLQTNDAMTVYIVVHNSEMLAVSEALFNDVAQYVDVNYEDMRLRSTTAPLEAAERSAELEPELSVGALPAAFRRETPNRTELSTEIYQRSAVKKMEAIEKGGVVPAAMLDESFNEAIMRIIEDRGIKKISTVYSKANITKAVFSKIRQSAECCTAEKLGKKLSPEDIKKKNYKPAKNTAIALCLALELHEREFVRTLEKAGYTLSRSVLSDVIVRYFVEKEIYDVFTVNEMLFKYDQALLGSE